MHFLARHSVSEYVRSDSNSLFEVPTRLRLHTFGLVYVIDAIVTHAVTHNTRDKCVRDNDGVLEGLCIDIWQKVARDLNISYKMDVVDNW